MNLTEKELHVLFVDDDLNIRTIAKIAMDGLTSWQVELAESGYEALQKALRVVPDLILLDVMMPRLDGKETLEKLRDNDILKKVPIIFVTAKVQVNEIEQYMDLGAAGVITKPFDPMIFADLIVSILQSSEAQEMKSCA